MILWSFIPRVGYAILPVLFFLLALVLLDSFRLVKARRIFWAMAVGCLSAGLSYVANNALMDWTGLSLFHYAIFVAPLVEESLKGVYVAWLLGSRQAGFLVDGAILGFATGAGFAIVENLYYLKELPDAPVMIWAIRGLGTAIMHGGGTAIFAIMLRGLGENRRMRNPLVWLPALLAAAVFHGAFNRLLVFPIPATALILVVLPVVLRLVYAWGERNLRRWLGRGLDRDTELLDLIREGVVRDTPVGRYLMSLRDVFPAAVVADMLCLLRLQAELSIQAKGWLLLRENGLEPTLDPALGDKLEEVRWLERSIGRTGQLALRPVGRWGGRNLWQRHLLEQEEAATRTSQAG